MNSPQQARPAASPASAFRVILLAIVSCFFAYVFYHNRQALHFISPDNLWLLVGMVPINLVGIALRGEMNAVAFSRPGQPVERGVGFRLSVFQSIANYLPLSAGLIGKGVALRKQFGLRYEDYATVSVYQFLLAVSLSGVTGTGGLVLLGSRNVLLYGSFGLLALSPLVLALPLDRIPFLATVEIATRSERGRRHVLQKWLPLVLLILGTLLTSAASLWMAYQIIDLPVPFASALLLNSVSILSRLLTLTPGAIGVREGLIAGLAELVEMDFQMAIMASVVDRFSQMVTLFGTGGLLVLRHQPKGQNQIAAGSEPQNEES